MDDDEQAASELAPCVAAPCCITDVVAAHERSLLAYASHLLRSPDGARDIVQEAFARLCEPRHAKVALPEWLFVVCRNLAIDRLRKERRMSVLDETAVEIQGESAPSDPSMRLVAADESRRLVTLLATLPPRQQEAVRLKFQQGLTYVQIANVMDTNTNNVAALIHAGLKALRDRIGE